MASNYNPRDWYWRKESATEVYSSARQMLVPDSDADYTDWLVYNGDATPWPTDGAGDETDEALERVLRVHGLSMYPRSIDAHKTYIIGLINVATEEALQGVQRVPSAVAAMRSELLREATHISSEPPLYQTQENFPLLSAISNAQTPVFGEALPITAAYVREVERYLWSSKLADIVTKYYTAISSILASASIADVDDIYNNYEV